jgi:DNA-binding response OmpR family regulator
MTKVIIVEDDPMISEIYQKKFSESGFEVEAADSGEQVLTLAKKEKIDLILLDLLMPKMNGFEVIKNIRQGQYDPGIKIIVFSNLSQKEDRDKALKLGANGFIAKSDFTPSALVEEVQRQINQLDEEVKNELRKNGKGETVAPVGQRPPRVLLIEDEAIFVEMFGDKLKQDGFEVDFSMNGQEGLKKALSGDYDIFVIDIILPGLSGDEVVEKLKMDEKKKETPIIVFSASVDDQMKDKVREMGVEAFFVKTQIVPSELSKRVAEILKKAKN